MALLLNTLTLLVTILLPLSSCLPHSVRRPAVQRHDLRHFQSLEHWLDSQRQRQQVAPDGPSNSFVIPSLSQSVLPDTDSGPAASDKPLFLQSLIHSAKYEPIELLKALGSLASDERGQELETNADNMLPSKAADVSDYLTDVWEPKGERLKGRLAGSQQHNNVMKSGELEHPNLASGQDVVSFMAQEYVVHANENVISAPSQTVQTSTIPRPTEAEGRPELGTTASYDEPRGRGVVGQDESGSQEAQQKVIMDILYDVILGEISERLHNRGTDEVKTPGGDVGVGEVPDKHEITREMIRLFEKSLADSGSLRERISSGDSADSVSHRGTNSFKLFHPVIDAIDAKRGNENLSPKQWKRDQKPQPKGSDSDLMFLHPLQAGDQIFTGESESRDHPLHNSPYNSIRKQAVAASGSEDSDPTDLDQAVALTKNKANEPFLLETLFESLKFEPQQPQLMLSLARSGFNRDNDADDVPRSESSPNQEDLVDDVVFGRARHSELELEGGRRRKDPANKAIVSWTRDFERWQPIPQSPAARQSLLTSIDDYDAADRYGGGAAADDEEKVQDWISAADMPADDQDYELQFPALKFLLSEKRVDVRKPGPHFDRMIDDDQSPSAILLSQQQQHQNIDPAEPGLRFHPLTQEQADNKLVLSLPPSEKRLDVKKPGPFFDRAD